MERAEGFSGFRARLAHLLTWLAGPVQNQQRPSMENDRQTRDGITRGNDDPDNRARQVFLGATSQTTSSQPQGPPRTADLSARADALLQRLERQQDAQQQALEQREQQARFQAQQQTRGQGRGRGMGW